MREDAWLTERLGRPAFTVDEDDDRLGTEPGFYQAKVPTAQVARVQSLEDAGMRVVDVNVTLRRPAAPAPAVASGVRDATAHDRPAVLDIAERDYSVSRFHLDPDIPDEHARALKREWADNYFAGSRGDRLLVAERDGAVGGLSAGDRRGDRPYDRPDRGGRIGPPHGRGYRTDLRAAGHTAAARRGGRHTGLQHPLAPPSTNGWDLASTETRFVLHGHVE